MHKSGISVLLALLLAASNCAAQGSRYHAAMCISQSSGCTLRIAGLTDGVCKAKTEAQRQTNECREAACKWCALPGKRDIFPCNQAPLTSICRAGSRPPPRNLPSPSSTPSSSPRPAGNRPHTRVPPGCVWTAASDSIVISLGRVTPAAGWTPTQRDGFRGLIYEKNKNRGIDPKGKRGKMCFNVRAKQKGNYFFAALSYAPHNTEHNDMWVNSPDKGFSLWKRGVFWRTASTAEWLKAYQNSGTRGITVSLKTKDFDGHRFLVPNVRANEVFRICISGRSYRYSVFRLYLVNCTGRFCVGFPRLDLDKLPVSSCRSS